MPRSTRVKKSITEQPTPPKPAKATFADFEALRKEIDTKGVAKVICVHNHDNDGDHYGTFDIGMEYFIRYEFGDGQLFQVAKDAAFYDFIEGDLRLESYDRYTFFVLASDVKEISEEVDAEREAFETKALEKHKGTWIDQLITRRKNLYDEIDEIEFVIHKRLEGIDF